MPPSTRTATYGYSERRVAHEAVPVAAGRAMNLALAGCEVYRQLNACVARTVAFPVDDGSWGIESARRDARARVNDFKIVRCPTRLASLAESTSYTDRLVQGSTMTSALPERIDHTTG